MNPFLLQTNSLSDISVCCTNIRSLRISKKRAYPQETYQNSRFKEKNNILIDTKISETEANDVCNRDFKYLLKDLKFVGTLTKIKGILILYNKCVTTI